MHARPRSRRARFETILLLLPALGLGACAGKPADGAATPSLVSGTAETTAAASADTAQTATPRATSVAALAATAEAAAGLPEVIDSWGVPGSEPGQMMLPFGLAGDGQGNLYVSDSTGVSRYSTGGDFQLRIGAGELPVAEGIAVGPDGLLYVTGYSAQVQVYDPDGRLVREIGEAGEGLGKLRKPTDLAFDPAGNLLVADAGNRYIARLSRDGGYLGAIGEPGTMRGQFTAPRTLDVDAEGRVYVGMGDDFLLQRFSADGQYLDSFGQGTLDETLYRTAGVAVDSERGIAYVSQSVAHAIQAFDLQQTPIRLLWQMGGLPGANEGEFNGPTGLYFEAGRLYVADTRNNRVQVLDLP
ncbi:MAG: NHL repeat-containing protein [Caldilineae bacterium]|nr:NHL repeat-containing protein [Caldilineae bacterium]